MLAEEAIKNAPTDVLCEAAGTLQKAHDFVEANEFSMNYGAARGETSCCFVGSVRQASGEYNDVNDYGPSKYLASELALSALDMAARACGYKAAPWKSTPGGVAEATIVRENDGSVRSGRLNKSTALETYRQALREMHLELMSREDAPVGVPA